MTNLTGKPYERYLDSVFPWKAIVEEKSALLAVSLLTMSRPQCADGSSFACIAGIGMQGNRLMHLSETSKNYLYQLFEADVLEEFKVYPSAWNEEELG